jgi:hypothetical protein
VPKTRTVSCSTCDVATIARIDKRPTFPIEGCGTAFGIGPFKSKYEATQYKGQLERAERIAGFVIDPDRQKKPDADRESGLSNREHKRPEKAGT